MISRHFIAATKKWFDDLREENFSNNSIIIIRVNFQHQCCGSFPLLYTHDGEERKFRL
jgi:hypothetical protein